MGRYSFVRRASFDGKVLPSSNLTAANLGLEPDSGVDPFAAEDWVGVAAPAARASVRMSGEDDLLARDSALSKRGDNDADIVDPQTFGRRRKRLTKREKMIRRLRRTASSAMWVVQAAIAVFHMFTIPYQTCMFPSSMIRFNALYITGYVFDVLSMLVNGLQMHWAARWAGCTRLLLFNIDFRASLIRFVLAAPVDALLWTSNDRALIEYVPYVRLIHLFGALEHCYKLLLQLQRSHTISYNLARCITLFLVITLSSRARTPHHAIQSTDASHCTHTNTRMRIARPDISLARSR